MKLTLLKASSQHNTYRAEDGNLVNSDIYTSNVCTRFFGFVVLRARKALYGLEAQWVWHSIAPGCTC